MVSFSLQLLLRREKMRVKTILIAAIGLLLVQCCCLSGLLSEQQQSVQTLAATAEILPEQPFATAVTELPSPPPQQPATRPTLAPDTASITTTQVYTVRQTLRLVNEGSAPVEELKLRIALIRDWEPYQQVRSMVISPSEYELVTDQYDNHYAEFWFFDVRPGDSLPIDLEFEVAVNGLKFDLGNCSGPMIQEPTGAERFLEVDHSSIQSLAGQLSQNTGTTCEISENIYTYVIDTLDYAGYLPESLGAVEALRRGSGDCTEYSDLAISLHRAAGIPAQFVEGITYSRDGFYDEGQSKHDWLEVYLPGTGWVPLDPTWGEESNHFARLKPDHIIITKGRNLEMLDDYHFWAFWWWGDTSKVTVNAYDESWRIWKK
jgi:transglutaminase-like putative cysteine protease